MRRRFPFLSSSGFVALSVQLLLLCGAAAAKDIGTDPPKCPTWTTCAVCPTPLCQERSSAGTTISRAEGNLSEQLALSTVSASTGTTLFMTAIYNSYNADGSRAQVDTVMGYGWTHAYNVFLFGQVGSMFRFGADGRVTRYKAGPGGTFTAATGYFETLVKNPDGSFTLTQKDQTVFTFRSIPSTPFLVVGPVYRLTSIVDRNGNTTTLTYVAGNLASVTDQYGHSLTFTYNAQKKLTSVTDPNARVTAFQYDSTGRKLTTIIDANGRSLQYTYNALYQLTRKIDKDGRTFTYAYSVNEPISVYDGANTTRSTLSNPTNWATDGNALAMTQRRVYIPSATTNTDGRGGLWQYQYDSNGYITQIVAPDGATTRYTYDPATLLMASTTDANSHTSSYQYDARGNLIQTADALGHVTTYTYEAVFNMRTSASDPRGRTTTYAYDAHGNRIQETDPLGQTRAWTYDVHGNVTSETDKNGHTIAYSYDAFGNRAQAIDALGNITRWTYDAVGNVTARTDANLHTTTYEYDSLNRRTRVTDPSGHVAETQYDGQGNTAKSIDRNLHATRYQYDQRQRLIATTDAVGNVETYSYDLDDNRVSLTDRNGHATTYQYDSQNRPTVTTDALGHATTRSYDPAGNIVSVTDANAHATTYAYDALNRHVTRIDAIGNVTQSGYDGGTLPGCPSCGATPGSRAETSRTDANGKVTYVKYDALDRVIRIVRKVGGTADTITPGDAATSYGYDAVGNRLTETEPNGNTSTSAYDGINRLTALTNAGGDLTRWTYDGVGNVIALTAPNGNAAATAYDALDRPSAVTDGVGAVAGYSYDAVGNRLSETDGNGHTTSHSYDALNRLVATTDALGKATVLQYDAVGNLLKRTDRNSHATRSIYDAINRRVSETDALGHTTGYQYDAVGKRVGITDANGHSTLYQYDAINRLTRETYADGQSRSFTRDGVGNIVTRTDQNGSVTTYSYNDLYFLVGRSYPSLVNDAFGYDLSGRMLTAQRGSWPVAFTYDGANRMTSTIENGRVVTYAYDVPGRTRTVGYPGGRVIVEHSDPRGRLDRIDDALSPPIVTYSYDAADRATSRVYRNGAAASYSYNANDWMAGLEHTVGATRIAGFGYDFDNEGNKQFEEQRHEPARSEAYQYDAADRLVDYTVGTLVGSTVPVSATQTAYSLDPVGNWSSKTTDAVTQTRTHDAVNELTSIDAAALVYDANGNLRADGSFNYVYDEENRLVRVTRNADSAIVGQYLYDALGRRVTKVASPSATFVTTLYFYDDARVIEEQNDVGATQATYVYGSYVDEVLTMDRGGQTFYYHQNSLSSVEAISDAAANVAERYTYDAYGAPTATDGAFVPVSENPWGTPHSSIGNTYLFTGRELNEETGLYFYRARYYDDAKGRFLQRDPFEYADGLNLYQYVQDKPTWLTDPRGLNGEDLFERIIRLSLELEENQGEFNAFERMQIEKELAEARAELKEFLEEGAKKTIEALKQQPVSTSFWSAARGPGWLYSWGSVEGAGGLGLAAAAPVIGLGIGYGVATYVIVPAIPGPTGPSPAACCASAGAALTLRASSFVGWSCKGALRAAETAAKAACAALGAAACTGACPAPRTCLPSFNPHDYNDIPDWFNCEGTVWYDCSCRC